MSTAKNVERIPFPERLNLSIDEAAVYSGIGRNTIRNFLKIPNCPFRLQISPYKVVIRRKEFEEFLASKDDFSEFTKK